MFNRDQTASIEVMDKLSGANKIPKIPVRYCKKCGRLMKHSLQVISFGFDTDTGKKITRLQLTYYCKKILHSNFEYFHLTDNSFNPWEAGKPSVNSIPIGPRLFQPAANNYPQPATSSPYIDPFVPINQTYPYYTNTSNTSGQS